MVEMSAQERAVAVVTAFAEQPEALVSEHVRWLVEAIQRTIIEYGNGIRAEEGVLELERRRELLAENKRLRSVLEEIAALENGSDEYIASFIAYDALQVKPDA